MQLQWPVHLLLVRHPCHQAGGQAPLACQPWPASSCPPERAAPWMDGPCAHLHAETICESTAKAALSHRKSRALRAAESLPSQYQRVLHYLMPHLMAGPVAGYKPFPQGIPAMSSQAPHLDWGDTSGLGGASK